MEDYSEEEQNIWVSQTTPDVEPTLPAQNFHFVISRIKDSDGDYLTKIWFSRQVRRFYAMGLLHEAMLMLNETESEVTWCDETPGFIRLDDVDSPDETESEDDIDGGEPVSR